MSEWPNVGSSAVYVGRRRDGDSGIEPGSAVTVAWRGDRWAFVFDTFGESGSVLVDDLVPGVNFTPEPSGLTRDEWVETHYQHMLRDILAEGTAVRFSFHQHSAERLGWFVRYTESGAKAVVRSDSGVFHLVPVEYVRRVA